MKYLLYFKGMSSLTKYLSSLSPAAGDGWLVPGLWLVLRPQLGLSLVTLTPGHTNRWSVLPLLTSHITSHSPLLSFWTSVGSVGAGAAELDDEWELGKSGDNPVHSLVFRGFLWRKLVSSTHSTLSRKLLKKIKTMEKENKTFLSEEAMDFKSTEYEEDTDFDFDDTSLFRVRTVFFFRLIHNHES